MSIIIITVHGESILWASLVSLLFIFWQLNMTESIATQSRYSAVTNLRSHYPALTIETVCAAIADEFYHVHGITQSEKVALTSI